MKEVTDLLNQAKGSIARAQLIGEQLQQRWARQAQERAIRRRSGAPVIRVIKAPLPKTPSQLAYERYSSTWNGRTQ